MGSHREGLASSSIDRTLMQKLNRIRTVSLPTQTTHNNKCNKLCGRIFSAHRCKSLINLILSNGHLCKAPASHQMTWPLTSSVAQPQPLAILTAQALLQSTILTRSRWRKKSQKALGIKCKVTRIVLILPSMTSAKMTIVCWTLRKPSGTSKRACTKMMQVVASSPRTLWLTKSSKETNSFCARTSPT